MSAITLTADWTDWGYLLASRVSPDPAPEPPTGDYEAHNWFSYPAWVQWEILSDIPTSLARLWVAQRPRAAASDPYETEIRLGETEVVVSGHARSVVAELSGAGQVDIWLDGVLAASLTASGCSCWQTQAAWVMAEANSGLDCELVGLVEGATGYYAQTGHTVRYFGAALRVGANGRWHGVQPDDPDKTHVWADQGYSGTVPACAKRQPVPVCAGALRRGDLDRRPALEAVVQSQVTDLPNGNLAGATGADLPVAGWLAGLDWVGAYTFANGVHALASPLGPGSVLDELDIRQSWVAVRGEPGEPWRTCLELSRLSPAVVVTTDHELLLPGDPLAASWDRGQSWYEPNTLRLGRPTRYFAWRPSGGYLCDGDWSVDDFGLCVGCRPAAEGFLIVANTNRGEVVVAALDAAEADGAPQPFLAAADDGTRVIGLLAGGAYREWRSPADGTAWSLSAEQAVGPAGGAWSVSAALGYDASQLAVGYDPATGGVIAWWRAGLAAPWCEPFTVAHVTEPVAPYVTQQPDGRWEVGWLNQQAWTVLRADAPGGPWSEP